MLRVFKCTLNDSSGGQSMHLLATTIGKGKKDKSPVDSVFPVHFDAIS